MTTIHISDETTKQIQSAIGTNDPVAIANVIDQLFRNEDLLAGAWIYNRSEEEVRQSAAECDKALDRMEAGEGRPIKDALADIAKRSGLTINQ